MAAKIGKIAVIVNVSVPGRTINSTPIRPTRIATHLQIPTTSPRNMTEKIVIKKGATKNIEKGERLDLGSFSAIYQTIVVNKIVERGQRLDESNSSILEVFDEPTRDTVTDTNMIDRATTIRRLLPGSVVRFSDLHVSPHVSKGKTASLHFTMEKLSVRLDVIVMEDGYIGDTVKVRNEESGEEMFATVTDEGKVAIN